MAKYCSMCGNEMKDDDNACSQCGYMPSKNKSNPITKTSTNTNSSKGTNNIMDIISKIFTPEMLAKMKSRFFKAIDFRNSDNICSVLYIIGMIISLILLGGDYVKAKYDGKVLERFTVADLIDEFDGGGLTHFVTFLFVVGLIASVVMWVGQFEKVYKLRKWMYLSMFVMQIIVSFGWLIRCADEVSGSKIGFSLMKGATFPILIAFACFISEFLRIPPAVGMSDDKKIDILTKTFDMIKEGHSEEYAVSKLGLDIEKEKIVLNIAKMCKPDYNVQKALDMWNRI